MNMALRMGEMRPHYNGAFSSPLTDSAPTFGTASLHINGHAIATPLLDSAPLFGAPALSSVLRIIGTPMTDGVPTLGLPAFVQLFLIVSASGLADHAPAFGAPAFKITRSLTAGGLQTTSHALGAPAFSQIVGNPLFSFTEQWVVPGTTQVEVSSMVGRLPTTTLASVTGGLNAQVSSDNVSWFTSASIPIDGTVYVRQDASSMWSTVETCTVTIGGKTEPYLVATPTPQTQSYGPGSYNFTIPNYADFLRITVDGAGGGGGSGSGCSPGTASTASYLAVDLIANGGGIYSGVPGTASGGDTNTTGGGSSGGIGGYSGGGRGSTQYYGFPGGEAVKTFNPGDLTVGALIAITVGAGGAAGSSGNPGQSGSVTITWY